MKCWGTEKEVKLFDSTDNKFAIHDLEDKSMHSWYKVMEDIPEDYKAFLEIGGKKYEVLNKEKIDEAFTALETEA